MPLLSAEALLSLRLLVRLFAKFILTVAVLWAVFYYFCDFTNTQSWVLGFAFVTAVDIAAGRKTTEEKFFVPHRLMFQLNMFPMLADLGLVEDGDAYRALAGPAPQEPMGIWSNEHLFHSRPIVVYVLSSTPELVHLPWMFSYSEQLDLDMKLERIKMPAIYVWSPEVFIRRWMGCYAIGLRVKDDWWKERKAHVPGGVVLDEDREWNFGTVRLTLARLPLQAVRSLYTPVGPKYQETVKEVVEKDGWKNEALGGSEIGYFGEGYDHKYGIVWVQPID
jgi:hypothetical protein